MIDYDQPIDSIGRTKVILVSPEGPAVISEIIVKEIKFNESKRLTFKGVVKFEQKLKTHLENTILPQIDSILSGLGIVLHSYEVYAKNIGAVSSENEAYCISGYSADSSFFIAILSASLEFPINTQTLLTGHISTTEGDISQVRGLCDKLKTAVSNDEVTKFICPKTNNDQSLELLKPREYENIITTLKYYQDKINIIEVSDTYELIKEVIKEEHNILSSLKLNYFEKKAFSDSRSNSAKIVKILSFNNGERFWKLIKKSIMDRNTNMVRLLLHNYTYYYANLSSYPNNFGMNLISILNSTPKFVLTNSNFFPLINASLYIEIIKFAAENDHHDLNKLYLAINGKLDHIHYKEKNETKYSNRSDLIDELLYRISNDYIELNITNSLDEALIKFYGYNNRVKDSRDFFELVTNFYIHYNCHLNPEFRAKDFEIMKIESHHLLRQVFPQKNELRRVIYNATSGLNGGIKTILNSIIIFKKDDLKSKHILATIHQFIDPIDYDLIKNIIEEIIKRESKNFNVDESLLKPEKYVENYLEIIIAYANSKESFSKLFLNY